MQRISLGGVLLRIRSSSRFSHPTRGSAHAERLSFNAQGPPFFISRSMFSGGHQPKCGPH
eukprot:1191521-Prorocentrum_minimum.AAC.3